MPSRPCWVEISTQNFADNFRFLKTLAPPEAELLAIVKADAYGHSVALCAPAAVRAGARWLGVTSVEEALVTRKLCPGSRIVVMGGVFPGQESSLIDHGITPVVWEPFQVDRISAAGARLHAAPGSIPVHLEIDSGMSRQGVAPELLGSVLQSFKPDSPLRIEAVMTHLYASDETNGLSTAAQLERLSDALTQIVLHSAPEWLSVGASAALLGNDARAISELAQPFRMNLLLRPGLALYGVVPRFEPPFGADAEPAALAAARRHLRPVLAWKTRVVSLRDIPAGTEIGYNGTFVATEPMRLALIAVGYADGLDRRLGNRFSLLIKAKHAPLVGRVSMDQAVVDITEIPEAEIGDEVVILGSQGEATVTAVNHADACGTIPWEVFTRIGPRVTRVEISR